MGIMMITRETRKRAAEIAAYAMRPENWYRPSPTALVPGENKELELLIAPAHRAVFSWTVTPKGGVYRHLSIGTHGSQVPTKREAMTIASWFGFTGGKTVGEDDFPVVIEPGPDWLMGLNAEGFAVVAQAVPKHELPGASEP